MARFHFSTTFYRYIVSSMVVLFAVVQVAAAQTEPELDVEQFSPLGDVTGTGWTQIYDPATNSIDVRQYEIIDGMAILEGDIVLGPISDVGDSVDFDAAAQNSIAVTNLGRRWDDGIVVYDMNGHPDADRILEAIALIEQKTPIRFRERTNESAYVRIVNGSGCSSNVGRTGSAQNLSLSSPGCRRIGTVAHEFFHALGFQHEQTRSDRDQFVTINFDNIQSGKEFNFNMANTSSNMDIGSYDYNSIMHYSARAFSKNGMDTITTIPPGIPIGNRSDLSDGDVAGMMVAYFADLQLNLEVANAVSPSESVTATLRVNNLEDTNIGSIIAMDVSLDVPIPSQSSYNGFSSGDDWVCRENAGSVECDLSILDRDAESILTLNFTAPGQSGDMVITPVLSAANDDPNQSNNTASTTVTVVNSAPVLTITAPANNSTVIEGDTVTLIANASDAEDGILDASIAWSSSIDGDLGGGANLGVTTLSIGDHTITASVSDSGNETVTATVQLTVEEPPNTAPVISISVPNDGASVSEGTNVTFNATANDNEDGNISSAGFLVIQCGRGSGQRRQH